MIILNPAFEVAGEEADGEGEYEVGHCEEEVAFEVAECVGSDVFRVLGEFVDPDDGEEGGVFDEGDELSG